MRVSSSATGQSTTTGPALAAINPDGVTKWEHSARGTTSGRIAAELTEYALDRNMEWSGSSTTAIHDAVAVAHLAVPDLVAVAPYHVVVDTTHGPARGRTVCDGLPYRLKRDGRPANADVGIQIDRGRFEALLIEAFGMLP